MKKIILITLLALFTCTSYAKSQSIDDIVAVVNDDVVTKSEFNHALTIARLQAAQVAPSASENEFQKQILDQLIDKKLQLQIAKLAGIKVTDAILNKAIARIAEQNQVPVNTLYERVAQQGMSVSDYRNDIREQIALQRLQQQEVVSHIAPVTPVEINNFMKSKVWQEVGQKEYQLNDILIPVSDKPSASELANAKSRAESIMAKIQHGQTLADISKAAEAEKNPIQTGDLGWRKVQEIPSAFADKVARMQKNELVGPIQTANGFHLIQLGDTRTASNQKPAPQRKEIENMLLQKKFTEALKTFVSKLRAQAFIESDPKKLNG